GLEQQSERFGTRINVGDLLQVLDGGGRVARFNGNLPAQQQRRRVRGLDAQHAAQRFVGRIVRAALIQRLRRREEDVARFVLFVQTQVEVGQLRLHGRVLRIQFQHL